MNPTFLLRLRARALGGAVVVATGLTAQAQDVVRQDVLRIDVAHGALLIHGNFCGPGNRGPGHPPVDALDLACAHHDACTPALGTGRLASCACHERLHVEAGLVARDPHTPPSVRDTAQFIADGAEALPCDE